MSHTATSPDGRPSGLTELVYAARGRIVLLAVLNFCWFMVLPTTLWLLADAQASAFFAITAGVGLEVARLLVRQSARRKLRRASMSHAAEKALGKDAVTSEVLADSAFWSAHIVEYAASIDLPATAGAAIAVFVTLGLAASRTGLALVAEVGATLLCAVAAGVVSNRLRRPGAYAIVDNRERTVVWMAAAVRDRGELASPKANAAFLLAVAGAVERWCKSEDHMERARTRHRLGIAFVTSSTLYVVARSHGLDPLAGFSGASHLGGTLSGTALLAASLPAAYALALHLDSLAIADSELGRLTFNAGQPKVAPGTRLARAPRLLRARGLTVHHGSHLALKVGDMELHFDHPLGIAGPNGSGKTTLATVLAGLLAPSSGSALLDGITAHEIDRDDVAFVPQDPVLIEPLSVLENLRLVAPEFDLGRASDLLRSLGLRCPLDTISQNLSRGEQRRIAIARALLKEPKLLVLDEPDAWLDVEGRRALLTTLIAAAPTTSVVIVSHRPDTLLSLETVIVLTAEHCIEAIGSPARLRHDSAIFRGLVDEERAPGSFESAAFARRAP